MIGDTIKRLREERGWTQEQLAEKMGYTSKSTINKIEKNINDVSQSKIIKFAQVFNCDPADLISEAITEQPAGNQYDPESVERAMKMYELYKNSIPEIQAAVESLLGSHQSDS